MIPEFDERGNLPPGIAQWPAHPDGTTFLDYFQYDNASKQAKGIISIDLAELP